MDEITRVSVYAKVIDVRQDTEKNGIARCHLKVGAKEIRFFRAASVQGSYVRFQDFKKNCYFLIEQENPELYQKILYLFPGDVITLEVYFDEQHHSKVKDMRVEKSTAIFDLWNFVNNCMQFGEQRKS